jgi:SSS family solute:Na+ symporter
VRGRRRTVGSLVATWIGTGSLFGSPDAIQYLGLATFVYPLGGAAGILLLIAFAGRARATSASSVPQILGLQYGRSAQVLGACALITAYMVMVSYQIRAGEAITSLLFPAAPVWLLPITFITFVVAYTALAGMVSVAWTDLVNGILISFGLIAALVWAYAQWDPAIHPIGQMYRDLPSKVSLVQWIGYLLPAFLLVLGDANLFQRFMSTDSVATARKSAFGMFFGVLILELAVIALALLGCFLLDEDPKNAKFIILTLATTKLPTWLGITILAAAIAIVITTADSLLLSASTSVSVDLLGGPHGAGFQRIVVVVLGVVALLISYAGDGFFNIARYAYTLYGASLTPALVCALVRPTTPRNAVVAGMAGGFGTALAWKLLLNCGWLPAALQPWDPSLPALAANLALIALVSVVSRSN